MKLSSQLLLLLSSLLSLHLLSAAGAIVFGWVSATAADDVVPLGTMASTLPNTAIPLHYAIALEPDLEGLRVAGSEVVDLAVTQSTSRIVLNATDIVLNSAWIDAPGERAAILLDANAQTAALSFAQPIAAGRHQLHIEFSARINKFPRGLFLVESPSEKGTKRTLATRLEPANARRLFPCWDDPAFKASISLTITVPRSLVDISNGSIAEQEPVTPILKQITFARTPEMSTSSFALVLGEFEQLSTDVDGTTVRVFSARNSGQARFALESGAELLRYCNEYFGLKYPLPKLDLVALPGISSATTNSWGAVTFLESELLFDPEWDGEATRRHIFDRVAHAIARQWLGHLVSMASSDNLWLNQALAGWMAAEAAEHFFPQWRTWLNTSGPKDAAMDLDARRSSTPLEEPAAGEGDGMTAFERMSRIKGQALMRMIANDVGKDAFRTGIRRYVTEHAYGRAAAADLWRALEGASARPVATIAASFAQQPGLPLLLAEITCENDLQRVRLRQQRFTFVDSDATPQTWEVPVTVGSPGSLQGPLRILLGREPADVVGGPCAEPVKLNLGNAGYYRVEYGGSGRAGLRAFALMPPADRVNLLADSWALVEAGRTQADSYLELLEQLGNEEDRAVWDEVVGVLERLDHLSRGRSERASLRAYARGLLRPVLDRLGWEPRGRDREENELLRARLIRALGAFEDSEVIAQARERFAQFHENPTRLRPSLREAVIDVVGQNARRNDYETLLVLARTAHSASERARYYRAAARAREEALARKTLALTLTDELPGALGRSVIATIASAGEQPELAWDFVRQNFAALAQRQGPSFADRFVATLMGDFSEAARATEVAEFAAAHATSAGGITAARAQESILLDAEVKARILPQLAEWLHRHANAD